MDADLMDADPSALTKSALDVITERIKDLDERYKLRNDYDQRALALALASMDERLLSIGKETDAVLAPITAKIGELGKPNVPVLSGIALVLVTMIGGIWGIIGLKVEASNSPLTVAIEQIKSGDVGRDRQLADVSATFARLSTANAALTQATGTLAATQTTALDRQRQIELLAQTSQQADVASREDRRQITERLVKVETLQSNGIAERRANDATVRSKLAEVETQFRNIGNIIGNMRGETERWLAIFYEKLNPGQRMPVVQFNPHVYSRETD